jgi:hypothetical protein
MGKLWRTMLRPLRIKPERMNWRRLGMQLAGRDDQERVERICEAVAGGFNAMISCPGEEDWAAYCDGLEVHYRPFAREGAAMGYLLRHPLGAGRKRFERAVVQAHPEGTYMHYVGVGLWHGMRSEKAGRLEKCTADWDPMYRMLCYDGFGFKSGFFDYGSIHERATRFRSLEGYRGRAALQGVGRSLWFRFMNNPERLVSEIRGFGEEARADLAGGLGLASVFVHVDKLEPVWELAGEVPGEWRGQFQLGMAFAFRARELNDPDYFEECLSKLGDARREGIRAALGECVRIEGEIRSRREEDGYRLWRERLSGWMEENLSYPLELPPAGRTAAA